MSKTTVVLPPVLEASNRLDVQKQLMRGSDPIVEADAGATRFIDAAALGMLVKVQRDLRTTRGGKLRLTNLNEDIRDLFRLTKLDGVIEIG